MNNEVPIRDQAERLRKKVERKSVPVESGVEQLPPRSSIHNQKQPKTKFKIKYPVIRLIALFFILVPISIFAIISYLQEGKVPLDSLTERVGFETIDVKSQVDEQKAGKEETIEEKLPNSEENGMIEEPVQKNQGSVEGNLGEEQSTGPSGEEAASFDSDTNSDADANSGETTSLDPGATKQEVIYHTVQPGETLFRVAMNYFKNKEGIDWIKEENHLNGNEIRVGQVLKIPDRK